jgi:hypothetical protein
MDSVYSYPVDLDKQMLQHFMDEEKITSRVKIEAYLSTYLELRKCSQLIIPAEYPDSMELGQRIDEKMKTHVNMLQQIKDPNAKAVGVQAVRKMFEKNFEEIVEDSESYRIHSSWADKLALKSTQTAVRPTIHELYYFKDRKTRKLAQQIIRDRRKIRQKTIRNASYGDDKIKFAFPEEFDKGWLERMGSLLGYPDCCIKFYTRGRMNGVNVEIRATQQLLDALKEKQVDTHAYYANNFLPCSPSCSKAIEQGYLWSDKLLELGEEYEKLYHEVLFHNTEFILKQPEIVNTFSKLQ